MILINTPAEDARERVALIKAQMEARLLNHIFDGQAHSDECRCYVCVQRLLDALVVKSDQITQEFIWNFPCA